MLGFCRFPVTVTAIFIALLVSVSLNVMARDSFNYGVSSVNGESIDFGYTRALYDEVIERTLGPVPVVESDDSSARRMEFLNNMSWYSKQAELDAALTDEILKSILIHTKVLAQEAINQKIDQKLAIYLSALEAPWLDKDLLDQKRRDRLPSNYDNVLNNAMYESFREKDGTSDTGHKFQNQLDAINKELDSQIEVYVADLVSQYRKKNANIDADVRAFMQVHTSDEFKDKSQDEIVAILAGAEEAKRNSVDPYSSGGGRIIKREMLLGNLLELNFMTTYKASDRDIKVAYDQFVEQVKAQKEYNLRMFVTNDYNQALRAIRDMRNGTRTFSESAQQYASDPTARENKGVLGWVTSSNLRPEFQAEIAVQKIGDYPSEPVEFPINPSTSAWAVIMVDGVRDQVVPTIEQMRQSLSQTLVKGAWKKFETSLVNNAKIED